MIKNRTIIEVEVNGRIFCLQCASESSWQEVSHAASMLNEIANEKIKLAQPPQQSANEHVEETHVEQS